MSTRVERPVMLLGFPEYETPGRRLAAQLQLPFAGVEIHRFPDGESRVTLPPAVGAHLIFCRSLDHPNAKLVELLLAVEAARALGAQRITLIAPYLCYMRQDIAFHPGEAVSQQIIGRFLATLLDDLITVDPHLHRTPRLEEAIPGIHANALTAAPLMSRFLQTRGTTPLLLGPDGESEQWVKAIAAPAGLEYGVATKERMGDREVRTQLPDLPYSDREVVLVDDMASTGRTLASVARQLRQRGARAVNCLVTHALLDGESVALLHESGIDHLWSSDSILHDSNAVELAPLLAEAVRALP